MKKKVNIRNFTAVGMILMLILATLVSSFPATTALASDAVSCKGKYNVKASDTINKIADKFTVRAEDLAAANAIYGPYYTIYVGQNLCIPTKSKVVTKIPKWGDSPAADFKVKLYKDSFTLTTSNFPKSSFYFIKTAGSNPTSNKSYTKLGRLVTGKGGTITANYPLPDKLLNTPQLWVCLKNVMTDANVCRLGTR